VRFKLVTNTRGRKEAKAVAYNIRNSVPPLTKSPLPPPFFGELLGHATGDCKLNEKIKSHKNANQWRGRIERIGKYKKFEKSEHGEIEPGAGRKNETKFSLWKSEPHNEIDLSHFRVF
jgi:hypothetical protein